LSAYVDASVIVALLTPELHSDRAEIWFNANADDSPSISAWVITEVSSALSIKVRTGALTPEQRASVLAGWQHMRAANLTMLGVTEDQFETAARFADRYDLKLRAGDALHLAIAAKAGCTLVTLDQIMAAAAPALGVPVELL